MEYINFLIYNKFSSKGLYPQNDQIPHSAAAGPTSNNRRLSQCGGAWPPSETLIHQEGESPAEVQCSIMPENSVQRAPENQPKVWHLV